MTSTEVVLNQARRVASSAWHQCALDPRIRVLSPDSVRCRDTLAIIGATGGAIIGYNEF